MLSNFCVPDSRHLSKEWLFSSYFIVLSNEWVLENDEKARNLWLLDRSK